MKLIAHRGGSGLRVENTLAAFAHAIELGAVGAELDVHLSRDGEVVVHHDARLNPNYCRHADGDWITPDEARPLSAMNCAEMRRYDIGTPRPDTDYARRFNRIQPVAEQHIPLLRDVIALTKSRSTSFKLVVEIKTPPLEAGHKPWLSLADATLKIIADEHFTERAIICSFDWGTLRYIKQRQPSLPTWFTTSPLSWFAQGQPPATDIPPRAEPLQALRDAHASGNAPWLAGFDPHHFAGSYPRAIAAASGDAWFPFHRDFTHEAAQELARLGLTGAVWSVNLHDPNEVARLAHAGAQYLVTDYPDQTVP